MRVTDYKLDLSLPQEIVGGNHRTRTRTLTIDRTSGNVQLLDEAVEHTQEFGDLTAWRRTGTGTCEKAPYTGPTGSKF